jgi:1-acyl-sn-glycerol-3-phosphate acyltransferase
VLIAALRSAATYIGVSLYVLVVAPIGMALALAFRWKDLLYVLGHAGVRLGLGLAGIRFRVAGRENVPMDRPVVFCANHQSNVDPPLLFEALHPRLHILYKAEINRIPIFGRALQLGGFIPVDRRHKEASLRSIENGAASIRSGNSFLIFPEGTRSKTADLLPFKKGGFMMAMKAGAPIVPVAIQGGRDAMRKGSAVIRPVVVSVRIGQPIETSGRTAVDRDKLIRATRERLTALLAEGPV